MKAAVAVLVLALVCLGCSSDDSVTVQGKIIGDPICAATGGQFQMLAPGGFELLVFIGKHTLVVLGDGQGGTCADMTFGTIVEVSGVLDGETITAKTVRVQPSTDATS